jgi:hemoglobin/transferrin/lactoferrin receptor protein
VGDINVSPGDSPYIDGYELLDLFSSYEITKDIEVGFTVTNVFDTAYTPALNTPGTGFTGDTGRGRTFLLTSRAQF